MNILQKTSLSILALVLAATGSAYAQNTAQSAVEHSKTTQSVQAGVNQTTNDKLTKKNDDTKKALAALEKSTGKLETILAREPSLKMAPIDVAVETQDFLASPSVIKALIYDAEKQLDEGKVQQARLI
ncbi:MAG: YfdX family protein [Thiomicrorhabdus sp.]|nr:YfdX family protein [Thiomicrorhabdus sp.]